MYQWEGEGEECVYVCCVDWKRKGEQEWKWLAKERKEGIVRYVVGEDGLGGVVGRHVGTKKNLPPPPFFLGSDWDVTPYHFYTITEPTLC